MLKYTFLFFSFLLVAVFDVRFGIVIKIRIFRFKANAGMVIQSVERCLTFMGFLFCLFVVFFCERHSPACFWFSIDDMGLESAFK